MPTFYRSHFYDIKKKLIAYHKFNEKKLVSSVIELIKGGEIVSLISDAGTPVISDPGLILIKECAKENLKIIPIPGVSAVTTALSVSGFDDKYFFYGFLPKKLNELSKVATTLKNYTFNVVFFIPAIKINFYLKYFIKHFPGREIFIAREMTKMHETYYREKIEEFKPFENPIKGEITVVLSNKVEKYNLDTSTFNEKKIKNEVKNYLKKYSLRDVVNLVAKKNNLSKKLVYNLCLKIK